MDIIIDAINSRKTITATKRGIARTFLPLVAGTLRTGKDAVHGIEYNGSQRMYRTWHVSKLSSVSMAGEGEPSEYGRMTDRTFNTFLTIEAQA